MSAKLEATPTWQRLAFKGSIGVDRAAAVIRGVILAEEGTFKDRRGEFDRMGIRRAVKLANDKPGGLKSRFTHPMLSSDGLGKYLGRVREVQADSVLREVGKDADGKPLMKERLIARGNLHLDPTALEEPPGGGKPLGTYLMDLAESDPEALGLSLVLQYEERLQTDSKNRPLKDEAGNDLPPLWMPTALHAVDAVDDGDATHSFLSSDLLASLPDALVRQGCELLDAQFAGKTREFVEARLSAFVQRYLSHRFGDPDEEIEGEDDTDVVENKAASKTDDKSNDDALLLDLALAELE
jgi:hypothetical protein